VSNLQFLCPLILALCENENKLREIFPSMSRHFAYELIVGIKLTAQANANFVRDRFFFRYSLRSRFER